MPLQAPAFVTVNPSHVEPNLLTQINQRSGFTSLLAGGKLRTQLGEDDLVVYARQVNLRTKMASGTAGYNELPGVDISLSYISTATYQFRTRAQYDGADVRAAGRWGVALPSAYRLGMRQANYQLARDACLYGMNPLNGEGLVNAPGATAVNLPADQNGNTTVVLYDNGQMAFFLASIVQKIKTATMQMGIPREFTIIGPQRTLGSFEYNVVQLVQFQREGAGTASTAETLKSIVMANGDKIAWEYDDTLIGKGYGGADLVIVAMPEVEQPPSDDDSTNAFGGLNPNNGMCITQYCDMAAPREILSPLAGGATDVQTEWRVSSGWPVRPQALYLISMPYS